MTWRTVHCDGCGDEQPLEEVRTAPWIECAMNISFFGEHSELSPKTFHYCDELCLASFLSKFILGLSNNTAGAAFAEMSGK